MSNSRKEWEDYPPEFEEADHLIRKLASEGEHSPALRREMLTILKTTIEMWQHKAEQAAPAATGGEASG